MSLNTRYWVDPAKPDTLQVAVEGYQEVVYWRLVGEALIDPAQVRAVVAKADPPLLYGQLIASVKHQVLIEVLWNHKQLVQSQMLALTPEPVPAPPKPPPFTSTADADEWMAKHA